MFVAKALCPLFHRALPAAARAKHPARQDPSAGADAEDAYVPRGWFDSSYELRHGLTVVEHQHLHGDTLELAVALWLQ